MIIILSTKQRGGHDSQLLVNFMHSFLGEKDTCVVALTTSTVRWIGMVRTEGFCLFIFPSHAGHTHMRRLVNIVMANGPQRVSAGVTCWWFVDAPSWLELGGAPSGHKGSNLFNSAKGSRPFVPIISLGVFLEPDVWINLLNKNRDSSDNFRTPHFGTQHRFWNWGTGNCYVVIK